MKIDRINEEDLVQIKNLLDELIDEDASLADMENLLREINSKEHFDVWGLYLDGKIAGTASTSICLDISGTCQPFLVLENFIVNSEFRRRGVGSDLLNFVESFGKDKKCKYILFASATSRPESHRFYVDNGYDLDMVQGFKKYL